MSTSSYFAGELFTKQPSVTPILAQSGKYSIGVRTITELNMNDFINLSDRELTLEVGYRSTKIANAKTSQLQKTTD